MNAAGLAFALIAGIAGLSPAACQSFTTVDFPGATATNLRAINPEGEIVGNYLRADGKFHGFLRLNDGHFRPIDCDGSVATFLDGINPEGYIVGKYTASDGGTHAFILRGGVCTPLDVSRRPFRTERSDGD